MGISGRGGRGERERETAAPSAPLRPLASHQNTDPLPPTPHQLLTELYKQQKHQAALQRAKRGTGGAGSSATEVDLSAEEGGAGKERGFAVGDERVKAGGLVGSGEGSDGEALGGSGAMTAAELKSTIRTVVMEGWINPLRQVMASTLEKQALHHPH